jgi:hypothetical protein
VSAVGQTRRGEANNCEALASYKCQILRCDSVCFPATPFSILPPISAFLSRRSLARRRISISVFQEVIEREAVIFARKTENKEEEGEARNDVAAKVEERVVQKMA